MLPNIREIDLRPTVPRVAAPTLVIHEPAFPFSSLTLCEQVAEAIPAAQLVVVNQQSIAVTAHEGHVAAMDEFLRSGTVSNTAYATSSTPPWPPTVTGMRLTPRETQVLALVASGSTNREIADD